MCSHQIQLSTSPAVRPCRHQSLSLDKKQKQTVRQTEWESANVKVRTTTSSFHCYIKRQQLSVPIMMQHNGISSVDPYNTCVRAFPYTHNFSFFPSSDSSPSPSYYVLVAFSIPFHTRLTIRPDTNVLIITPVIFSDMTTP